MELLSEIWDKTTDAFTALSEGVSHGLIRLFGSSNERKIRQMRPLVAQINELEPSMTALSDEELRARTESFAGVGRQGSRSTTCYRRRSRRAASRGGAT